ncbi:hypothetical protein [Type-D symbiont of Plautia stali]|uniref:hypothetical protein n=1 Tax=Type-D symbiont of Plautia stali TaxID=1560356 RepID=UPI00128F698A|nr:hypothetical protein [Type-D symbiont of Plautia stali]
MRKIIAFSVLLLSGCSVSTGLVVQTEDQKEPLMGTATASLIRGDFYVENVSGLSCSGKYNQFTTSPMLKVAFTCSDGRSGAAQVMRYGPNLENGSGSGKLSDGTRFRILIGDATSQASQQGYWSKF